MLKSDLQGQHRPRPGSGQVHAFDLTDLCAAVGDIGLRIQSGGLVQLKGDGVSADAEQQYRRVDVAEEHHGAGRHRDHHEQRQLHFDAPVQPHVNVPDLCGTGSPVGSRM